MGALGTAFRQFFVQAHQPDIIQRRKDSRHVMRILHAAAINGGGPLTAEQIFNHPGNRTREEIWHFAHPHFNDVKIPGAFDEVRLVESVEHVRAALNSLGEKGYAQPMAGISDNAPPTAWVVTKRGVEATCNLPRALQKLTFQAQYMACIVLGSLIEGVV